MSVSNDGGDIELSSRINGLPIEPALRAPPPASPNPEELYEKEWWRDLPPDIQEAYAALGWDERMWDEDLTPPPSWDMGWDELTLEMQDAALFVGYTQEAWDGEETTIVDVTEKSSEAEANADDNNDGANSQVELNSKASWHSLCFEWNKTFCSLPPGVALSTLLLVGLLVCASICICKRMLSASKRHNQFDDEPYSSECLDTKGASSLSYIGKAVHSTLQRQHYHHHRKMWNMTSGRVVGDVHYTPRDVWDTSLDPGEGHDDWLPEKLAEIIGRTEAWCDVMTLGQPDGKFLTALQSALQKIAIRSKLNSRSNPIVIRIVFGNYPARPVDCDRFTKVLTKNLPMDANLHIWVGAWRRGFTWNHAKLISVDGVHLHTGGHNMWEEPYLMKNPVHDLSLEMEGRVAIDGHHFADQQWKFIKDQQSTWLGFIVDKLPDNLPLVNRTRVTVSQWPEDDASVFPPQFTEKNLVNAHPQPPLGTVAANDIPLISIGRQGSMESGGRPSDDAILAMINSSRSIIRLIIQDLGPLMIPGTNKAIPGLTWPKEYLAAIGKAIYERGVDIEIVLSNSGSTPGELDGGLHNTPYGNGWDCVDAASEIIKAIQRTHSAVDDSKLRTMINDNLRICFIRHNKSSAYSNGKTIGLHSKHFIVDDRCCYIGSQNLYDADLAEWGVMIDDEDEVGKILSDYFVPMWRNSYIPGLDVDVERVMDGLNVDRDG
eukprot:CAMPEP_0181131218 /NCGR_PEP_ID=MMETSP1071-20121207/30305_1 /TAXON_ID=35127 /ORGANISM="Thalassiosira sp., Strain NH16" /LENGTH=715 /DNA_ID=CAMNT_0023217391 /DNA_START=318 /DNA_END=2465 /DNA_ORIENTATION=-